MPRAALLSFVCFAVMASPVATSVSLAQQNTTARVTEDTARVERIDKASRMLTAITPEGTVHQIYVGPEIKEFDSLKAGDQVTVRFTESMIVRVARDGKRKALTDTTAEAQAKAGPHGQVVHQVKATVKIEELDRKTGVVKYRTADDQTAQTTADPKLLEGINVGDTVEVEVTRARAISVARASR